MGDYHVHLHPHGRPGPGDPAPGTFPLDHIERYVEQAVARGLDEVCFTEHLYRLVEAGPVLGEFWAGERSDVSAPSIAFIEEERNISLDVYVRAVCDAQDRGLPVKLGLEVDFFPETIGAVLDLLDPYPWDMLLGSVHWIGGMAVDIDEMRPEFERRGADRMFEEFFGLETALAASGAVDVLAHVDLVKFHGLRPAHDRLDLYEMVASAAAGAGTAVEISSAGLDKACAELYPSATFLDVLVQHDVDITLASDAHRPAEVGRHLDRVLRAARTAGYANHLSFDRRVATTRPLPVPPSSDGADR